DAETRRWTCEACDSTGVPPMTWEDLHGTPVSIAKRWRNKFPDQGSTGWTGFFYSINWIKS
ncbi:MAG: hypothetical protein MN733_21040, partial [Nitrososphaera sp.]|nr:hypothetical protein [Nitrososphaera sp.]